MYIIKDKEIKFTGLSIKNNRVYNDFKNEIENDKKLGINMDNEHIDRLLNFLPKCYIIDEEDNLKEFLEENADITDVICLFLNIEFELAEKNIDKTCETVTEKAKVLNDKMKKYNTKIIKR